MEKSSKINVPQDSIDEIIQSDQEVESSKLLMSTKNIRYHDEIEHTAKRLKLNN